MNKRTLHVITVIFLVLLFPTAFTFAAITQITILPTQREKRPSPTAIVSETGISQLQAHKGASQSDSGFWMISNQRYRYQYENGSYIANQMTTINKKRYFFDENGYMKVGWAEINDNWFYFDRNGSMKTGWLQDQEKWYYLASNGAMSTGWIELDQDKYYLDVHGVMQTGWLNLNGQNYYFNETGILKDGWINQDGISYFVNEDFEKATGWKKIEDQYYYFGEDGKMLTGWLILDKKVYYLKEDGSYDPGATRNNHNGQRIALTFDDGPSKYTNRLLDILEKNNSKATFFAVADNIADYPEVAKRILSSGNELGSHSYNHEDLTKETQAGLTALDTKTKEFFTNTVGQSYSLVRPPYGRYNDLVKSTLKYPLIMWSLDTLDWKTRNAEATVIAVLDQVKEGDIILCHDIHEPTIDAMEILIPVLKGMGYDLVTVPELANSQKISLQAGKTYSSFH